MSATGPHSVREQGAVVRSAAVDLGQVLQGGLLRADRLGDAVEPVGNDVVRAVLVAHAAPVCQAEDPAGLVKGNCLS